MGLDGVELILAVEDSFQIHIADDEACSVCTVGDLHRLVVSKLQGQTSSRCLTSAAFYRIRRGIIDALGAKRGEITPSTRLASILPLPGRRRRWRLIQRAISLKLPDLEHPLCFQLLLLAAGVALAIRGSVLLGRAGPGFIVLAVFLGLILGRILVWCSRPLAVEFPSRSATVGELTRDFVAQNHAQMVEQTGGWNENQVWAALCRLITLQNGIDPERITPEATILDDLGID